jgi:hypothetical protein
MAEAVEMERVADSHSTLSGTRNKKWKKDAEQEVEWTFSVSEGTKDCEKTISWRRKWQTQNEAG